MTFGGGIDLQWKRGCWYELRRQRGVQQALEQTAKRIALASNRQAGTDEFKVSSQQGRINDKGRWRTTVITAGRHAMRHNAINQTLLKNMEKEKR